jgi:hypothetical protein
MKNFFGEKIYVLGLESKDTPDWRKNFDSFIPNDKLEFCIKKGAKNPKNEGKMDCSMLEILNHSNINNVSMDIFKNHIDIMKNALQSNYNCVMILEDDASFPNWNEQKWQKIQNWLSSNKNWDIFYLGYCSWPSLFSILVNRDIVRLFAPLCLHGYIINKQGIQKILEQLEMKDYAKLYHVDKYIGYKAPLKKFGAFPMICFQKECPALYLKACDKMGVRFQFKNFCRLNEWMSVGIPFILFFVIFLIVLFTIK